MPARKAFTLPAVRRAKPRFVAASLTLHGIVVLLLVNIYGGFSDDGSGSESAVVVVPMAPLSPVRAAPPSGPHPARGRPLVVPVIVAPLAPVPLPTYVEVPVGVDTGGVRGGAFTTGGLAMGPTRGDPRLWVTPQYIPESGGRPIDMDSITRRRMLVMADLMDSIARNGGDSLAPNRRLVPPAWTFERNGRTYGIDQQWIHLGAFKLPTMLLALIPMNIPQGNIDQMRANARMMDMRADILRAAARSEAEEDFRRAVAQIRERRDRERQEQRQRDEQRRQQGRESDRPIP